MTILETPALDGRRRRSQDSRARIIAAMLELVQEGGVAPSAEQVAARADVGLRTVFRHFTDMDSLYREMSAVIESELAAIIGKPLKATNWRDQVLELVGRRAAVYETITPFKRASDINRHGSSFLEADHARMVAISREILRGVLAPEVGGARFEAIDLMLSFEAWTRLRRDQGLGQAQAEAVIEETLRSLLA